MKTRVEQHRVRLISGLCLVLLLAAFTPSAIRLCVIGSQTFGCVLAGFGDTWCLPIFPSALVHIDGDFHDFSPNRQYSGEFERNMKPDSAPRK